MAIGIINLAKKQNELDIFYKWNSKIKTIENQRKKIIEQGYLTDAEATEMEQLMVEAQADYEYLIEAQKKKDDADKVINVKGM
jgi:deoxyribose-phosphate aldolase